MPHRESRKSMIGCCLASLVVGAVAASPAAAQDKPRLIVSTDIGGDPDDQQSMVRLMNYANEFRIEGLIASATGTPGEVVDTSPKTNLIRDIVDAYGQVRPNLVKHASGFPEHQYLVDRIKAGSSQRGTSNVGAGKNTAASDHIINVVDDPNESGPVWVTLWGGGRELAQALFDVQNDPNRTAQQKAAFVSKLRVYDINDQDGTGAWMKTNFSQLRYIETKGSDSSSNGGLFRGMYQNDSSSSRDLLPNTDVRKLVWRDDWVRPNVTQNHGVLGAKYPDNVSQNPSASDNKTGVKEGDTPSWFYPLSDVIGLSDSEDPTQGGWGGRFKKIAGANNHYTDGEDLHWSTNADAAVRRKWTVARWREAYQNDFAARMDWSVAQNYSDANHAPVAAIDGSLIRTVGENQQITLDAGNSTDPDGNTLSFSWFYYDEPSTFNGTFSASGWDTSLLSLITPDVSSLSTIHLILQVTDNPLNGLPAMTRYQRVVLTVDPSYVPEPGTAALASVIGLAALGRRRRTR